MAPAAPAAPTTPLANCVVPAGRRARVWCDGWARVSTVLQAGQGGALQVVVGTAPNARITQRYFPPASVVDRARDMQNEGIWLGPAEGLTVQVIVDPGTGAMIGFGAIHGVEYDA